MYIVTYRSKTVWTSNQNFFCNIRILTLLQYPDFGCVLSVYSYVCIVYFSVYSYVFWVCSCCIHLYIFRVFFLYVNFFMSKFRQRYILHSNYQHKLSFSYQPSKYSCVYIYNFVEILSCLLE